MLIGCWKTITNSNPFIRPKTVAYVKYISMLSRSDKRKDRVEIAPENLHLAALEAEEFGKKIGQPMMVIGWYHSHPHITVFPSHVDVNTQLSQQLMDNRFFGMIISCFDCSSDNTEKTHITCFQSEYDESQRTRSVHIDMDIVAHSLPNIVVESIYKLYLRLPRYIHEEHHKEYHTAVERITYSLKSSKHLNGNNRNLPGSMTHLYNVGVYGQSISSLIDNVIIPITHLMDMKTEQIQKEIDELTEYKKKLLQKDDSLIQL